MFYFFYIADFRINVTISIYMLQRIAMTLKRGLFHIYSIDKRMIKISWYSILPWDSTFTQSVSWFFLEGLKHQVNLELFERVG